MFDIFKPKRPTGKDWQQVRMPSVLPDSGCTTEAWVHKDGFFAISAVEAPEPERVGAEYHISISKAGGRCTPEEALWVLLEFGIPEAEEDNHHSGIARQFWRPCADKEVGNECPCKEEETAIVEDGGAYIWRP